MLRRLLCAALVMLGFATSSLAQFGSQRQDDLGIMSVPSSSGASPSSGQIQRTQPLPIPAQEAVWSPEWRAGY